MSEQVEQPSAPATGADAAIPKHPANCRCIKPKPATATDTQESDLDVHAVAEDGETPPEETASEEAPPAAEELGEPSAEEPAPAPVELPSVRAISIDIYEKGPAPPPEERKGPHTINVPSKVVIEDQPVYLPADSRITVTAGTEEATAVTLTLFARRVRIGFEDELDGPVGVPAGQSAPVADDA
ncbi:hypothetical protein [Nonomuraea sp. JJY05]|uniref:hypothetical protein n=1 Tax=Nonomuraea sp. JJY05 TaxID=3350255 RepID=UPI00373F9941